MTLPVPTVACINGHAFAGGCLLALAMDYRVMRTDAGFVCMNEIDMGLVASSAPRKIKPGVFKNADLEKRLAFCALASPRQLVRDRILKGVRLPGKDALAMGVVDAVASSDADALRDAPLPRPPPLRSRRRRTIGARWQCSSTRWCATLCPCCSTAGRRCDPLHVFVCVCVCGTCVPRRKCERKNKAGLKKRRVIGTRGKARG